MGKVKEYIKDDLVIVWKPGLCIHSAVCVKTLPEVYDPRGKPWIKPEGASVEALKDQIAKCPSGALSYYMKNEKKDSNMEQDGSTRIEVASNGPLLVHGSIQITHADGSSEAKKRVTAFCRCGSSGNKPFCDGSHKETGFSD